MNDIDTLLKPYHGFNPLDHQELETAPWRDKPDLRISLPLTAQSWAAWAAYLRSV